MTGSLLSASSHTKPEVRKVLEALVADGWTLRSEGHWGKLYCPCEQTCVKITVGGTPKSPSREARRIRQEARRCPLPEDDPRRPPRGRVAN
jgi:hypothetical protein